MKQLVHTGLKSISVTDGAAPTLQDGMAIIRIHQVGICGSELHLYRHGDIGGKASTKPFVSGHECVGTVVEVSNQYEHLLNQRVVIDPAMPCLECPTCLSGNFNLCPSIRFLGLPPTSGAFCEYLMHPARHLTLAPEGLTDDEAVLCEPFAIAIHAVELGKPKPAQTAVVLGCGAMGLCTLIALKQIGVSKVMCTDIVDERLDMAKRIGANICSNPLRDDIEQIARSTTDGLGFDMVFECAGAPQTYLQTARICKPGGRVVITGSSSDGKMTLDNNVARRSGLDIRMVRRSRHTLPRAIVMAQRNGRQLSMLATHHFELHQAAQAFELADQMQDGVIRAMISFICC